MLDCLVKSTTPTFSVAVDPIAPNGDVLPHLARLLLAIARRRLEERREIGKAVRE
jgi:hypothetical protein